MRSARSSPGLKPLPLAERFHHVPRRLRFLRRVHRLVDHHGRDTRCSRAGRPWCRGCRPILVGAHVVGELHLLALHADHLERHAADADALPHRRHVAEHLAGHLAADEDDAALQPQVLGVGEAAGLHPLAAHPPRSRARRRGRDSEPCFVPQLIGNSRMNSGLTNFTNGRPWTDSTSSLGELDALAGPLAAGLGRGLARPDDRPRRRRRRRGSRGRAPPGSRRRRPAASPPRRCPTRCRASTGRRARGCATARPRPRGRCRRTGAPSRAPPAPAALDGRRVAGRAVAMPTSRSAAPRPAAAGPRGAPDRSR